MLEINIVTIFPDSLKATLNESILKRAQEENLVKIKIHDLRKWTTDKRKTVDDKPFGGGPGMVMMVEPIYKAVKEIKAANTEIDYHTILTSAKGKTYTQEIAKNYSQLRGLIIICGHYEGVDERVAENIVDEEISIGNYVLTGGELPAAVITDSVTRLLPGVLGNEASLAEESHNSKDLKEYPQYTRPAEFTTDNGDIWPIPDILKSGHHKQIADWRSQNTSQD